MAKNIRMLASAGMDAPNLKNLAQTDRAGGNRAVVRDVCNGVYSAADLFHEQAGALESNQQEILAGWYGESADTFRKGFSNLISSYQEVEKVARSLADWADGKMNAYMSNDMQTAESFHSILL